MKMLWNNFKIAFAMFSKIPMPQADWTKENMKYFLCFFPWIGAVIGVLTCAAAYFGKQMGYEPFFMAAVLVLIPVLVTGGIHVDGLLDTSDALSSWQERERRLEILKDSHTGAFAVITACVFFLCEFGSMTQLWADWTSIKIIACGYVVSRCFSGIGVVSLPKAKESGTVAEFARKAENRIVQNVLIVYLVLLALLMVWTAPVRGAAAFITAVLVFVYYRHMALKYFGGTTGDLSGYFLCLCEAGMMLVLAVVSRIWPVV